MALVFYRLRKVRKEEKRPPEQPPPPQPVEGIVERKEETAQPTPTPKPVEEAKPPKEKPVETTVVKLKPPRTVKFDDVAEVGVKAINIKFKEHGDIVYINGTTEYTVRAWAPGKYTVIMELREEKYSPKDLGKPLTIPAPLALHFNVPYNKTFEYTSRLQFEAAIEKSKIPTLLENIKDSLWCVHATVIMETPKGTTYHDTARISCVQGAEESTRTEQPPAKEQLAPRLDYVKVGSIGFRMPEKQPWTLIAFVKDVRVKGNNVIVKFYAEEVKKCPELFGNPCRKLIGEVFISKARPEERRVSEFSLGIAGLGPEAGRVEVCFEYEAYDLKGNKIGSGRLGCVSGTLSPGVVVEKKLS